MSELAVEVRGLHKSYGSVEAVRGIDLSVPPGMVYAVIGPNGAGKTTMLEILEGHRTPTSGEARVLGYDPTRNATEFKQRIGIVLQSTGIPNYLRVEEAVDMFRRLLPAPAPARRRARPRWPGGAATEARAPALRRSDAPARRGDRAGRRPGPSVPRRTDDGPRPGGTSRGVGRDRAAAQREEDGTAYHALHGRGRIPGRPSRDHLRGEDRRRGHAGGASLAPSRHADQLRCR